MILPHQNLRIHKHFLQKKCFLSNKMFKIADLTCKIMRKFFLAHAVVSIYIFNIHKVNLCSIQLCL